MGYGIAGPRGDVTRAGGFFSGSNGYRNSGGSELLSMQAHLVEVGAVMGMNYCRYTKCSN